MGRDVAAGTALDAGGVIAGAGLVILAILWVWPGDGSAEDVKFAQDILWIWITPLEPARFYAFTTLGAGLVAWLSGITLKISEADRGDALRSTGLI